jgi:hypothetical protein
MVKYARLETSAPRQKSKSHREEWPGHMTTPKISRSQSFSNDIIFVDGMSGTGKSVVTSLVSAMHGVEKKRIDPVFEYLTYLNWLGMLDLEAAAALQSIYADYFTYHNAIGREVNLRLTDDSGFLNSPQKFRYLLRLFKKDGDHVISEIDNQNPGTLIASNYIAVDSRALQLALGTRLKFIEVVRHPLHLVEYWTRYLHDLQRTREFSLSFDSELGKVPWMIRDWIGTFLKSSEIDRVLLLISRTQQLMINGLASMPDCLIVPFENLVISPWDETLRISAYLKRDVERTIHRILRNNRLPRTNIGAGRASNSRSWITKSNESDTDTYRRIFESIKCRATAPVFAEFSNAIQTYDEHWPSQLTSIHRNLAH